MNKYDIKYIIKKILIYSGVALILMFVKSCNVEARTIYTELIPDQQNGFLDIPDFASTEYEKGVNFITPMFNGQGLGDGYILFNMYEQANINQQYVNWVSEIVVVGNDNAPYTCELTEVVGWIDNPKQINYRQVKCYMNLNNGLKQIRFKKFGSGFGTSTVRIGGYITFIGDQNSAVNVNVNQQQVVNEIAQQGQLTIQSIETETNKVVQQQQQTNQNIQDIKDVINNDNVDNQQSSDFFNNFGSTTNQGLQDLIKKPIDIIDSFYNTCIPITFNIPYFETTITLPCISSIQNDFTSVIFPIIRVIINGLLCYRILTKFIDEINKLKDPNNSDLEVVDL